MAVDFEKINSYREKIQPRDNTRVSKIPFLILKKEKEEEAKQDQKLQPRDNTVIYSKPEPKLKEEFKPSTQNKDNKTFLSPMPNRSAALDEQAKVNAIKNEVYNNLERTKYANFWTVPYAGFSGKQAFDLGTNLVKEGTYTGVLEGVTPIINKLIGKGINKILPKKSAKYSNSITQFKETSLADNVDAFENAMDDVYKEIYLGDGVTLKIPGSKSSDLNINPKIMERIKNLGLEPAKYSQTIVDKYINTAPEMLTMFDKNGGARILSNYKNKPFSYEEIQRLANDMKSAGNVGGYFNGNIIVSHNSPTTFSTLSPEAIRFDTFHEAAHRLYELLRINPDVQTGNYAALNPNHPIGKLLKGLLNQSNDWVKSGEELGADLWGWRGAKKIGFGDLTDEQVKMALEEPLITRHFSNEALTNKLDLIKEAIKKMPAVMTGIIGANELNKKK